MLSPCLIFYHIISPPSVYHQGCPNHFLNGETSSSSVLIHAASYLLYCGFRRILVQKCGLFVTSATKDLQQNAQIGLNTESYNFLKDKRGSHQTLKTGLIFCLAPGKKGEEAKVNNYEWDYFSTVCQAKMIFLPRPFFIPEKILGFRVYVNLAKKILRSFRIKTMCTEVSLKNWHFINFRNNEHLSN